MATWVRACNAANIENEDVIRFDYQGKTYALFRSPKDEPFYTDGYCTHEDVHLADGWSWAILSSVLGTMGSLTTALANLHVHQYAMH